MDFTGIQQIIDRIHQIESKFEAISQPETQSSFQNVLQKALQESTVKPLSGGIPANGFVSLQGHLMDPKTAQAFLKLDALIRQRFPGKEAVITSTTEGMHQDPNHFAGKAVDFVVPGISVEDSKILEELSRQAGFSPFNEYTNNSKYKTGDHIHLDLRD